MKKENVNRKTITPLMFLKKWSSTFVFLILCQSSYAQVEVDFNLSGAYEYSGYFSCIAAEFDQLNRPYLYTANIELGLVIFDISDPSSPVPIDTIPNTSFDQLKVNDVHQVDNYLYLALGSFQGFTQKAGLAILNIENPAQIIIEDQWSSPNYNKGGVVVEVEEDYAYLAVMSRGLIVLDISTKDDIQFKSHILPDLNWPVIPGIFNTPNARGIAIKDDILYLCFDAGGIRVIDLSDREHPEEIHQYINTDLTYVAAPAYNKIVLKGNYAFTTVDYCGLEVLDISNADTIIRIDWINPWNCRDSTWFGSEGHTNQLALNNDSTILFVSGGDSEVLAFDVSNPEETTLIGAEAMVKDSAVTWGLNIRDDELVLCFLDNSGIFDLDSLLGTFQPYYSNYGGIQLYHWTSIATNVKLEKSSHITSFQLKNNPVATDAILYLDSKVNTPISILVTDIQGMAISSKKHECSIGLNQITLDTNSLSHGVYIVTMKIHDAFISLPFIKQ